eukprot:5716855-Pyramimonas_sp.AAC.1
MGGPWSRLGDVLGPVGGMSEAILSHLELSRAILDALGSLRPSECCFGSSWALYLVAARPSTRGRGAPLPRSG